MIWKSNNQLTLLYLSKTIVAQIQANFPWASKKIVSKDDRKEEAREKWEKRAKLFLQFVNIKKTSILYLYENAQVSWTIEYQFLDYLWTVLVS